MVPAGGHAAATPTTSGHVECGGRPARPPPGGGGGRPSSLRMPPTGGRSAECTSRGNPRHRLRVEHDAHSFSSTLIHPSDEDGDGRTTIAVDRATREWAVAQAEQARRLEVLDRRGGALSAGGYLLAPDSAERDHSAPPRPAAAVRVSDPRRHDRRQRPPRPRRRRHPAYRPRPAHHPHPVDTRDGTGEAGPARSAHSSASEAGARPTSGGD